MSAPPLSAGPHEIHVGDARSVLRTLPAGLARTCVTSPPYWNLRDYGVAGQHGLEATLDGYLAAMVDVFREVRRVLADDGTLWLNIGDCYAGSSGGAQGATGQRADRRFTASRKVHRTAAGVKPKDLVGVPWALAFALRADGWFLRADVVWHKPNPMPETVRDRPTKAHEYVFLLAKRARYYYDQAAVAEPCSPHTHARCAQDVAAQRSSAPANGGTHADRPMQAVPPGVNPKARARWPAGWDSGPGARDGLSGRYPRPRQNESFAAATVGRVASRNKRSVWTISTQPFRGAHFATYPERLVEPCVRAGSAAGDVVLDPFAGAGTTGVVAERLGRRFVGVELNPAYARMARERIAAALPPLFPEGTP